MEIEKNKQLVRSGLYIIINPSMHEETLLSKLKSILKAEIDLIQIWDNFSSEKQAIELTQKLHSLCQKKGVPLILNNQWELLQKTKADGIHFDQIPSNFEAIKNAINRPFICGITCNNDISSVNWAENHRIDYISFCSLFPSSTSNSCELVDFATVKAAKNITNMPIYLAGGISPNKMPVLQSLPYDGIAVVSGVMDAKDPLEAINQYTTHLKSKTN